MEKARAREQRRREADKGKSRATSGALPDPSSDAPPAQAPLPLSPDPDLEAQSSAALRAMLSCNSDAALPPEISAPPYLDPFDDAADAFDDPDAGIHGSGRPPSTDTPGSPRRHRDTVDRGDHLSRLSFSSPSRHSTASITTAQRHEAFNYRRLNQLSLRQKSARRRKMWQRVVEGDGMRWVRAPPQSITIGEAPFGYTPGNTPGQSLQSAGDLQDATRDVSSSWSSSQPRPAPRGLSSLFNLRALMGRSDPNLPHSVDSLTTSLLDHADDDGSPDRADGDAVGGGIGGSYRGGRASAKARARSDSFGDSVVMSGSPGFTSIFSEDEAGWGLRWEKVESGGEARRSSVPSDMSSAGLGLGLAGGRDGSALGSSRGDADGTIKLAFNNDDLVAVAALPFKEKQLWFLEHMGKLQRPWSDGAVRLDVRRGEFLLQDSVRQFADLRRADLHKWMRVQFTGEPGIDAGGLEREWFTLVIAELFSLQTGLFTCSSGDAMGGTYHINPTSGAAQLGHLRFFKVGRLRQTPAAPLCSSMPSPL